MDFVCHLKNELLNFGERLTLKGTQFPVISNSATTTHKLQGCTVKNIFVAEWHYKKNWVYVVLSRVRTRDGLYFNNPLRTDVREYRKPEEMKAMIRDFKDNFLCRYFDDDEYNDIIRKSKNLPNILHNEHAIVDDVDMEDAW